MSTSHERQRNESSPDHSKKEKKKRTERTERTDREREVISTTRSNNTNRSTHEHEHTHTIGRTGKCWRKGVEGGIARAKQTNKHTMATRVSGSLNSPGFFPKRKVDTVWVLTAFVEEIDSRIETTHSRYDLPRTREREQKGIHVSKRYQVL